MHTNTPSPETTVLLGGWTWTAGRYAHAAVDLALWDELMDLCWAYNDIAQEQIVHVGSALQLIAESEEAYPGAEPVLAEAAAHGLAHLLVTLQQ